MNRPSDPVESAVDAERFIEDVGFENRRSEIRSQRSGFGFQSSTGFAPQHSEKEAEGRMSVHCYLLLDISHCAPILQRSRNLATNML